MTDTAMTDREPGPETEPETRSRPAPIDFASAIIASGIADMPVANLVETAMERLVAAGVPLARMHVGFRILHPLFDGMSISWTDEAGVEVGYFENLDADNSVYRLSPFYFMLSNQRTEFRARLDRDACVENFPLLRCRKGNSVVEYY
jgi:adenylate cyclase